VSVTRSETPRSELLGAIAIASYGIHAAVHLSRGGEWIPTAVLTHVGALVIGLIGVRRLGLPRGAAIKATAAFVPLWALTRVVTPPWANVNVAFSVYQGWQAWFASYPPYFAMLIAFGLVTFVVAEQLLALVAGVRRTAS
jgi:hypothetical protein